MSNIPKSWDSYQPLYFAAEITEIPVEIAPSGSWLAAHPLQTRARAPETGSLRWRSAGMELSRDWMRRKIYQNVDVGNRSWGCNQIINGNNGDLYNCKNMWKRTSSSLISSSEEWVLFRQSLAGSAGALFLSWLWSSDLHGNHHPRVYFATSRWEAINSKPLRLTTAFRSRRRSRGTIQVWTSLLFETCKFKRVSILINTVITLPHSFFTCRDSAKTFNSSLRRGTQTSHDSFYNCAIVVAF